MKLTIDQALQRGIAAHKEGKLREAEGLYRSILQSQPEHAQANHNLGVLAVAVNEAKLALPYFRTALKANPNIEKYWLNYIDALIKVKYFENARDALDQARNRYVSEEGLKNLEKRLIFIEKEYTPKLATRNDNLTVLQTRETIHEEGKTPAESKHDFRASNPPQELLNRLLRQYQTGQYNEAEKLAVSITQEFPDHQFAWKVLGSVLRALGRASDGLVANRKAVALLPDDAEAYSNLANTLKELGRLDEAVSNLKQAIKLKPDSVDAHFNIGNTLKKIGRFEEAADSYKQAIALKPNFAIAHYNLGNTLKELSRLDEAEISYKKSIALNPAYPEAHYNLGNMLQEIRRLKEAETNYIQAIAIKSDFTEAYWNLHGIQETTEGAVKYIDKCLEADRDHIKARLMQAALRFYRGDKRDFEDLMRSELKQHPYMRSFAWVFSLPILPELYFNKWSFFDAIIEKSIKEKPFYEFGVWKASSFKYLIGVFKIGYGFDTFTGLPEDWDVGSHIEKKGSYTNDGHVPNIEGGTFIVGEFKNTLPLFFSRSRPIASVINFDADLYTSTICALNFSKSIIDKDTILIFDELLMNDNWEQDEFKALSEFCSINHLGYEVIAISFFTKQVGVKIIGI